MMTSQSRLRQMWFGAAALFALSAAWCAFHHDSGGVMLETAMAVGMLSVGFSSKPADPAKPVEGNFDP